MIPLLSDETLCYSIQGYPGLTFSLIYSQDFIINASKSEAVILDSVKKEVVLVDQEHFIGLCSYMMTEVVANNKQKTLQ